MDDLKSISLGSEFGDRSTPRDSRLSVISVQSLSSARGSTPLTKRRRYYDATKPMENDNEVPLHRLRCLRGLHKCGLLVVGDKETDTKTRRVFEDYLNNAPRSAASTTRPRKEFPTLRARSRTISGLRNQQFGKYIQNGITNTQKNENGLKSVTFALAGEKRPNSENIVVKRPPVRILQQSREDPKLRPYSEKLLLRRPTTKTSRPLTINDAVFISLAKTVQLKPINFRSSNEQYLFYNQNFPLLLDAHAEEKKILRKRTPTPEIRHSPEVKREMKLKKRLNKLETSLDTLDKETEDVDFRTVLRDDVFYPNRWPWNEKKSSDHEISHSALTFDA